MITKESRVLFQGDSITDCGRSRDNDGELAQTQFNSGMGDGYARLITADIRASRPMDKIDFVNRGISGNRVVDLYARWKVDCLNLKPDLISILIGVNDTWHTFMHENGVELDRYEQVYRMLLEWTKEVLPQTTLVLMEPFVLPCGHVKPAWEEEMAERRKIVIRLSEEFDTLFVPLQKMLEENAKATGPEYWLPDGVHPSAAGHRAISDAWLKIVS